LRYNGRIDDNEVGEVKQHNTRDAIEDLLNNRDVAVKTTKVFGCSTKWADKTASADDAKAKYEKEPVELNDIDADGIRELMANKTDKYRVINLWATWCGPCIHEMPALVDINRMYRKRPFELITISLDLPNRKDLALETLQEKHVALKNYISVVDKDTFAAAFDPKWLGPVPCTIIIAPGGEVVYRQQEEIDVQALKKAIVDKIGRTYASDR
jgi:thiol-disulfide isomerase/thioredoxin